MTKLGGHTVASFRSLVADGWKEHTPEDPITWLPANIRFPDGWETSRFDWDDAPHVRGVIELGVKNPQIRKIILPWATRLTKTTTVEGLLAWKAAEDPCPMAALFPDNEQLDQIDDHIYQIFEKCAPIAAQLQPSRFRNKKVIRLRNCRIRLASGGKKSSVSGYPARWIGKFEFDKTNRRKSSEADPAIRIDSRASGFKRDVKIFEEGSPAKRSESRMAKAMESEDNIQAQYHVQCPHCRKFQTLHHDNLEWEKNESGRSEPDLAERTAWYRCEPTGCRIENHERRRMMQTGRWVMVGQKIDDDGDITGESRVQSDTIVFGPLSKLYSLLITGWGVIASELVKARHAFQLGDESLMEKLYSEGFGLPWDPQRKTVKTNDLARRMRSDDHELKGVLPPWTSFLTFTCDVGLIESDHVFYWMVVAWGLNARGGIVDWGAWQSRSLLMSEWQAASYPLSGDSATVMEIPIWGQPSCIDVGKWQAEIAQICNGIKSCYPSKGDSNPRGVHGMYYPGVQRIGLTAKQVEMKRKAGAFDMLFINSAMTQQWRLGLVEGRIKPEMPGFVSLPGDVCESWEDHEEFLNELTADQLVEGKWIGQHNEYGDTLRYARALAECFTQNGKLWGKLKPISVASQSAKRFFSRSAASQGGDDRPFVQGFS